MWGALDLAQRSHSVVSELNSRQGPAMRVILSKIVSDKHET